MNLAFRLQKHMRNMVEMLIQFTPITKSLKCIFLGYSRVQKGYRCYCPNLRHYFVSTNVTFFETTPFSLSSPITSQREDNDLLVYTIASPALLVSPAPTLDPIHIKPLII